MRDSTICELPWHVRFKAAEKKIEWKRVMALTVGFRYCRVGIFDIPFREYLIFRSIEERDNEEKAFASPEIPFPEL